ncbi:MAG: transcription antitermination factor NusB [Akkermansiaceae bacterium]|jgi:transcription antitermination factor NusB
MASRRQVREAAVQFLYALETSPETRGGEDFWELVNDRDTISYDRARVKVLAHFQQGREASAGKLEKFFIDNAAAILALDPSEKLARDLKSLAATEINWADRAGNLLHLTKANTGGWRRDLERLLLESDELRKSRHALVARLEDYPALRQPSLLKLVAKLDSYDERARMVRFPENFPEQRDLEHLHQLRSEMNKLADDARALATQVEDYQSELDGMINEASSNFDISRLARVDLSILRLAAFEILKLPDLDAAVSISEAIDLARDFSGDESASFVNGVLDQIAKIA